MIYDTLMNNNILRKNDIFDCKIDSLSNDGSGVTRIDGIPVFVPFSCPGDRAEVRILKPMGSYAFGRIESLTCPSPDRIVPECPAFGRCGGCTLSHISYQKELECKRQFAEDALRRIGGLDIRVSEILSAGSESRYRNKVQFPVSGTPAAFGLYAARSHRVIQSPDCLLQPKSMNNTAAVCCRILNELSAVSYDELAKTGEIRHLLIRSNTENELLVCVVSAKRSLPFENEFAKRLMAALPQVKTVLINVNSADTNVILGPETRTLAGPGYILDRLCGVPVKIDVYSFYQINHPAAELLYGEVNRLCGLTGKESVLDLYCGAGTIGLSLKGFDRLIGVEIVESAVQSARGAAADMGIKNAEFIAADAGNAAAQLCLRKDKIDVVVTDPPRAGCDKPTLDAIIKMSPQKIVMVSCNAATAARDIKYLCEAGYSAKEAVAVDLFPRTAHVETVCLLCKK